MNLLPFHSETIVLPYDAREVADKLWKITYPISEGEEIPDRQRKTFKFNGWVKNEKFRISRQIKAPENFLPIICGTIEATSSGSILLVRYKMFFSSKVFLIFWSITTLLITLFFLISYKIYIYAFLSFSIGIVNYAIAIVNFNIQVKKSKIALHLAIQ